MSSTDEPQLEQGDIAEFFWKDHYSLGDEWYDSLDEFEPRILHSVGIVVGSDDEYYYISNCIDPTNKSFSVGIALLKNCVVSSNRLGKTELLF